MSYFLDNKTCEKINQTDKDLLIEDLIIKVMGDIDFHLEKNDLYESSYFYMPNEIENILFKFENFQEYWKWLIDFESLFLSDYNIKAKTLIKYIRQSKYDLFNEKLEHNDENSYDPFKIWRSIYENKNLDLKDIKMKPFTNLVIYDNKDIRKRINLYLKNMLASKDVTYLKLKNGKSDNYIVSYNDWYIFSLFYIYQEGLNIKEGRSNLAKFDIERSCTEDSFKTVIKNVLHFIDIYIKEPGSILISQLYRIDDLFKIFKIQTMTKYFLLFQEDKFLSFISKNTKMDEDEKKYIKTTIKYSVFYDYDFIMNCLRSGCKNPFYIFGMITYLHFRKMKKTSNDSWLDYKNSIVNNLNAEFKYLKELTIEAMNEFNSIVNGTFDVVTLYTILFTKFFKHMEKNFSDVRKKMYESGKKDVKNFLNEFFNAISDVNREFYKANEKNNNKENAEDFICYEMTRNGYYLDNDVLKIYLEEKIMKRKDPIIKNLAKDGDKWTNVHIKNIKDYMSHLVNLQCTNLPRSYFKEFEIKEKKD